MVTECAFNIEMKHFSRLHNSITKDFYLHCKVALFGSFTRCCGISWMFKTSLMMIVLFLKTFFKGHKLQWNHPHLNNKMCWREHFSMTIFVSKECSHKYIVVCANRWLLAMILASSYDKYVFHGWITHGSYHIACSYFMTVGFDILL